jgi:hypothetical protein
LSCTAQLSMLRSRKVAQWRNRAAQPGGATGRNKGVWHGEIGDKAGIPAVDPSRRQGADRTGSGEVGASGVQGDAFGAHLDTVNGEPARQQG